MCTSDRSTSAISVFSLLLQLGKYGATRYKEQQIKHLQDGAYFINAMDAVILP